MEIQCLPSSERLKSSLKRPALPSLSLIYLILFKIKNGHEFIKLCQLNRSLIHSHELVLSTCGAPLKYSTNFLTCYYAEKHMHVYMWSSFSCSYLHYNSLKTTNQNEKSRHSVIYPIPPFVLFSHWQKMKSSWLTLSYTAVEIWQVESKGHGPWSTKQKSAPTTCNKASESAHCSSICPSFP